MNALYMIVKLCALGPDEDATICPASIEVVERDILQSECFRKVKSENNKGITTHIWICLREVGQLVR